MALSQTYQEWEQQTRRQGLQQGLPQERQAAIANLMRLRFGEVDRDLQAIIPALINLSAEEYTQLLWQLSWEELLQQFDETQGQPKTVVVLNAVLQLLLQGGAAVNHLANLVKPFDSQTLH